MKNSTHDLILALLFFTASIFTTNAQSHLYKPDSVILRLEGELKIAREWQDTLSMLKLNHKLMKAYLDQGNYTKATAIFHATAAISGKVSNSHFKINGILTRNLFYQALGQINNMQIGVSKAFELLGEQENPDPDLVGQLYLQSAFVKQTGTLYRDAQHDYLRAIDAFHEAQNSDGIVLTHLGLANLSMLQHDLMKAGDFIKQVNLKKEILPVALQIEVNLSTVHYMMLSKSDSSKAVELAKLALDQSIGLQQPHEALEANRILAQLYENKGQLNLALYYHKAAEALYNALHASQLSIVLDELESDIQKSSRSLDTHEIDEGPLSYFQVVTSTIVILLIILLHFSNKMRQTIILQRKRSETRLASLTEEVERLQQLEIQLKDLLETKERTITSQNVFFEQKDKMYNEIRELLCEALDNRSVSLEFQVRSITKMLENVTSLDKEWSDFKITYDNVSSDFFRNLKRMYPSLTTSELRLCGLLKMNVNLKEAARIMGVAVDSVKTARYRLRRKFNLDRDSNLVEFIMQFDSFSDTKSGDDSQRNNGQDADDLYDLNDELSLLSEP